MGPEDDPRMAGVAEAVEEALAGGPQMVEPPPPLILTGLVVEVRPSVFMGQACVAVTVKNQIGVATCAVPVGNVPQLIEQLQLASAQAQGLTVEPPRLIVP